MNRPCNRMKLQTLNRMTQRETIEYLQSFGIIATKKKCVNRDGCPFLMELSERMVRQKSYFYWRCICHTTVCVRDGSEFLTMDDNRNRLSLEEIVQLTHCFVHQMPIAWIITEIELNEKTVYDWFNLCCDVCYIALDRAPPMGGVDELFEIDEALMRGNTRKNNRGRQTPYDRERRHAADDVREIRRAIALIPNAVYDDDDDDDINNMRNYGNQVEGRWVFGIAHYRSKQYKLENQIGCETRYFHVDRRDAATLIPLIQRHIVGGSIIFSDQWRAYNSLTALGYEHHVVNHSENFVDPTTLVNTQLIESTWRDLRLNIVRKHRNVGDQLKKHLAEHWWRSLYKNPANKYRPHLHIFEKFLMLISEVYGFLE